MKLLILIFVLSLVAQACATVTINCPSVGPPIEADINGPDITALANAVITLLPLIAAMAAKQPTPAPPVISSSAGSVTLTTIPIFGKQSVSCGPVAPHTVN